VPAEGFPPGEYIRDFLEDRGWTQHDLAEVLGRPLQMVNEIILDKRRITPETAKGLAEAFGTTAQLWLNLDSAWQLFKASSSEPNPAISLRARIYSKGPIQEMVKRGWIEHSSNPEVLEQRMLDFFSIENLEETPNLLPVAARMSTSYDTLTQAQVAWMCRVRNLARAVPVNGKFNPAASQELVQRLQALLGDPEEVRHVPRVLGDWGVRFLVIEHLTKTKIDGACLWLDQDSPTIAVSLRYDRIDYFWFTLMHEVKHVLNGDGWRNAFLALDVELVGEGVLSREEKPGVEREADAFAEGALIPPDELDDFIVRKGPLFSEIDIRGFATLLRIHPGLVVGQLHHRTGGYSKFRHLLAKVKDRLIQSALTDGWGHYVPATV
jgi:HTH-type transcriptional regulator/antitoxin HigA